jgi:hypothetical protein|tara:strand:+ start:731 stop:910 length:180 start_codon:yes stop_codon:yes gene_type:complete
MTKSLDTITKTLQEKGENLTSEDIDKIRLLFADLNLDEQYIINDVEEIIDQIQSPIKDT